MSNKMKFFRQIDVLIGELASELFCSERTFNSNGERRFWSKISIIYYNLSFLKVFYQIYASKNDFKQWAILKKARGGGLTSVV